MPITPPKDLADLYAAGDYHGALKLAASWATLGEHRYAIQRGWAAVGNPEFYRSIGEYPDAVIEAGLDALCERYDFEEPGGDGGGLKPRGKQCP